MRLLFSGWRHPTIPFPSITTSKSLWVRQGSSPHFRQPQTALPFWWDLRRSLSAESLGNCLIDDVDVPFLWRSSKSAEEIQDYCLTVICARFDFALVFLTLLFPADFCLTFLSRYLRKSRSRFRWWASSKGRDHRILIACSSNLRRSSPSACQC